MEVYYRRAEIRVPISHAEGLFEVGVSYQGCAEAGLCYPPETRWVILNAVGSAAAAPAPASGDPTGSPNDAVDGDSASSGPNADDPSTSSAVFAAAPETGAALPPPATEERRLASLLAERGWLLAAALFFLGGIGLAFTPCVLPMVPILSSIIISSKGGPDSDGGDLTRRRAFGLS